MGKREQREKHTLCERKLVDSYEDRVFYLINSPK